VRYAQPNYIYRIPERPGDSAPAVEKASPPGLVSARFVPNDPDYRYQWNFVQVGAEAAWEITRGSPSVVVAVIDTGVAYRNFGAQYVQVEDLVGTTFVAGWDFVDDDAFPDDLHGHGTHVTGTIAQVTNNHLGVAGLAPNCSIMPIRVLDATGSGDSADVIRGIQWAVDHGAKVVNLSLGLATPGPGDEAAVQAAAEAGVVLVAAAGNDGTSRLEFPASSPYVISVGATRYDHTRASYSSYGPELTLVAPGGDVTVDQNGDGMIDGILQNAYLVEQGDSITDRSRYRLLQGTSQATPHVSAAAALLLANGFSGTPLWQAVRDTLTGTAQDLGPPGRDDQTGAGLLRIDRALAGTTLVYSISGRITDPGGAAVPGIAVAVGTRTTMTGADGSYAVGNLPAGTYIVTPTHPNRTFTPASRTMTVGPDRTGVDFTASALTYSVSGTVTYGGSGLAGVSVTAGDRIAVTDARGVFQLAGLQAGAYTVTPSLSGYTFAPPSLSVSLATDLTGVVFTAGRECSLHMAPGLYIVAVPGSPTSSHATSALIFGGDASALYGWVPSGLSYSPSAGTPVAGFGYFIRIVSATDALVTTAPAAPDWLRVDGARGWNLLGNPRAESALALDEVRVDDGGQVRTFADAVASGAVQPYGWVWDSASAAYRMLHSSVAGASRSVPVWGGWFIEALRPVSFLLPTTAAATSAAASSRAAVGDWALTLDLDVSGRSVGTVCVGRIAGRPFSAVAPPAPGSAGASVAAVAAEDATAGVFRFRVEVPDGGNATLRVSAAALESLPREVVPILTDDLTGKSVSLRACPSLEAPLGRGGVVRAFTLVLGRRADRVRVEMVDTVTSRGLSVLTYRLSSDAMVSAAVLNAAGRVVARLDAGTQAPGIRQLVFSGRSDRGSRLPAGEYLVRLTARADTGESAGAVARVVLQ
jgi:serine protease